jgi:Fe-S-cluster containining protein
MLCPEGTAKEWDVSAFNLRIVKTKTMRKTINADKEEWIILDDFEGERLEWEVRCVFFDKEICTRGCHWFPCMLA